MATLVNNKLCSITELSEALGVPRKNIEKPYPDYQTNIITVRLNSLATPRNNLAIKEICQTLNDYEAVFLGTNLRLFFKTATAVTTTDQEF